MTAVEVFATYAPKHRKPWSRILIENHDRLYEFGGFEYQPRHRAEVSR